MAFVVAFLAAENENRLLEDLARPDFSYVTERFRYLLFTGNSFAIFLAPKRGFSSC